MSTNVEQLAPDLNLPKMPPKVFGIDPRFVAPILITLILLGGQFSFGILESFPKTIVAILSAMVFETFLSKITRGKLPHLASAYIAGISVGILVRSPFFWTFALCAAIAITSKYVLRIKDRHIWNPSNFGICAMLILAPFATSILSFQWGNDHWSMMVIWILGAIIIFRVGFFHITLTYVLSFLTLGLLRSYFTGDAWLAEIAPLTGAMYQLFIFFMITDPKTTVRHSKYAQCVVAFLIAVVEVILRLNEIIHAPFYALFIVGPIANLVDIYWLSPKRSER